MSQGKKPDPPVLLLIGQAVSAVLAFASAPVTARVIGAEGRGYTATATSIALICAVVVSLGMPQMMRRTVALDGVVHDVPTARMLALAVTPATISLGVLCSLVLLGEADAAIRLAALLLISISSLTVWWMIDLSVLMASHRFRWVLLMQIASPAILLTASILMLLTGRGTTELVIYASIAGTIATWAIGFVAVGLPSAGASSAWSIVKRSARFTISAILDGLGPRASIAIGTVLFGAVQTGYLSIGVTLASLVLIVGQTLAAAYFPEVAKGRRAVITVGLAQSISLTILAVAVGAIVVPWLIPILFGDEFVDAICSSQLILLATLPMVVAFCVVSFLNAQGRAIHAARLQLLGLVGQMAILLILGGPLGASGAAIAMIVGFCLVSVFGLRALNVAFREIVPTPRTFVAAIVALLRRTS